MNKDWTIRDPFKEGEKPIPNSYYLEESKFTFICKKCSGNANLYCAYEYTYGISHVIKCSSCGEEEELYGCDG